MVNPFFFFLFKVMTRFIRLRKFETMSLLYAIQGFKLSDCEWLQDSKIGKTDSDVRHVPPTASMKQHEIFYEFIYWLFECFLIPLVQVCSVYSPALLDLKRRPNVWVPNI